MNVDNEKHRIDIKNILRDLAGFYTQKITDDLLSSYASKLIDYDLSIIIKAVDELSNNAGGRFPSLAEFKSVAANYSETKKRVEEAFLDEHDKEHQQFQVVKKYIDSQIPQDKMAIFAKKYFEVFFGRSDYVKELNEFGLTLEPFKKCMYFDLYMAKLKGKKALEICSKYVGQQNKARKIYYWH